MSDSEYSASLDVNGLNECEKSKSHSSLSQQQQQLQNVGYSSFVESFSSSEDSSITSTSSDESDDSNTEDTLELAKIGNKVLNLPRGLCENASIFHEFFSLETWQDLPLQVQNHLQQFLPRFNEILPQQMATVEQKRTIFMLFNNELSLFGKTPLTTLQHQLDVGNCRPDILKLRQNIIKSRRREQRFQHCEHLSQMAKQLFLSRQRLLDIAYKSSPDTVLKLPALYSVHQPKPFHLYTDNKLSAIRARKRFYDEISQIAQQSGVSDEVTLSADEDDNCLITEEMKKDSQLQQQSFEDLFESVKSSASLADRYIYSTVFKKRKDIEDEEAFRLQQKMKQSKLSNRNFKYYLREHKRRKLTEPTLPEFETSDIRLRDVCARAQMGGNFRRIFALGKAPGRKPKSMPNLTTATTIITSATNSTINTLTEEKSLTDSLTLTSLPLPSFPPKLSEPPALVPIQPTLKKPETYHVVKMANLDVTKSLRKEHQHSLSTTSIEMKNKLNVKNNSNDTQMMSATNNAGNFNLCINDSSLLIGSRDAFNMLDNEVELQQEEVETFESTYEETIPPFLIGSDVVIPTSDNNNMTQLNETKGVLLNVKSIGNFQKLKQMENISQPVPKLEPISRFTDSKVTAGLNIKSLNITNTELIQETHACYFSLIRDFFCSTPNHRMRYDDLRNKIDVWLRNPITALNEWYSLTDNWSNLLRSAINFLTGEFLNLPDEYVPYIEHKVQLNIFQWIGAGRDSDTRLSELCTFWMEKRKQPNDKQSTCIPQTEHNVNICAKGSIENDESRETSSDNGGITPPPPPPRCPTTWTVRAATLEEIAEFQKQERNRFEQPHKAYTYRMHGYESVVGPVKGIYTPMLALSKARGHSMMVGDRPNFVTILTLVRDATARLPNGEGTRAEISELLKCSQYINRDASENVLQTIVSGALDRMHTEHDPCVRYDPKRKIWIYLHRNRTEEEFERIHQQNQTMGKMKKLPQRKPKQMNITNVNSNKPLTTDNDNSNLKKTTDVSNDSGALITIPSLVPSNPVIVSNNVQRQQQVLLQQQQKIINTSKNLPVPPLKYNIPPQQVSNSQQKSLLKTTIRTENKSIASSNTSNLIKQHGFQMSQSKSASNQNTTPIVVATPQGMQTVHVSNATSVMSLQTSNQKQLQNSSSQQHRNLTANLAGKRVSLNKPIIINQVTQQTSASSSQTLASVVNQKLKSQQIPQKSQLVQNRSLQTNQHQLPAQQQQQQQQSSLITPISIANNIAINIQSTNMPDQSGCSSQSSSQSSQSTSLCNKQNIIRFLPTSNIKPLISSSTAAQIVNRQRVVTTNTNANRTESSQQQKIQTGLQILSNNGNVVTVGSGIAASESSKQCGTIVKVSPQQFASLQQQKQVQQQHIIVKQTGATKTQTVIPGTKPQRVIIGKTAIMGQSGQCKNIVLQQIPVVSSSIVTPSQMTRASSSTSTIGVNKIQSINAKTLTPQQQRILIQNLKQQQQQNLNQNQIQHKAVQMIENTSESQSNMSGRTQTFAISSSQQTTPKTVVVVSQDSKSQQQPQQNITRIIKTSPQLKSEFNAVAAGTRVLTSSSGQIISLDSLIQKQGGTLRITGTGNTQTIKTNQHTETNTIEKPQQQQQHQQQQKQAKQQQSQQFAIVSVPNSIISLGNNSNFTVLTTQAGSSNTTSLLNLNTTKVSPSIVSTGTGRVITATAAGTKIIAQPSVLNAPSSNIRVINTINQTANFNLATLQGKQVVLTTSKTCNSISKAQQQSLQKKQSLPQSQQGGIVISGQTVKLQQGNFLQKSDNIITNQNSTSNLSTTSSQMQTVIMGNQILRVQQIPQAVATLNRLNTSNNKTKDNISDNNITTTNSNSSKTIFIGTTGQTLRLQPASSQSQTVASKNIVQTQQNSPTKTVTSLNTTTPNRVVLAVQGTGQIFLSPNFQGGNINLKSLQNMKVVSLAQHPATKIRDSSLNSTTPSLTSQQTILKTTSTTTTSDTLV